MEFEQTSRPTALHRPLVAADPHIDPHRLVAVCCQHSGDEPLGVCLLIPVEDEARPWSESTAQAERLLHDADVLLGAGGISLESGRPLDHQGWLRRVVGPPFHWPHPRGRAA